MAYRNSISKFQVGLLILGRIKYGIIKHLVILRTLKLQTLIEIT